jgi:hypothetical protein
VGKNLFMVRQAKWGTKGNKGANRHDTVAQSQSTTCQ